MARLIDLLHLGRDRVIGAYELEGLIVDPGPSSCLETLLAGLHEEPRGLLLTHIHLDHAGASGSLVRRFPKLRVYVHEVGASHLVDPAKLIESAGRLYGSDGDLADDALRRRVADVDVTPRDDPVRRREGRIRAERWLTIEVAEADPVE